MAEEKKQLPGLITGLVALLSVIAFIVLGFTTGAWHLVWMVFLAIPITAILADMMNKEKDRGDSLIGVVALLAVVVFMLLGFFASLWHIAWVAFLAIPITAIIVNIVKAAKKELGGKGKEDAEAPDGEQ